MKTAQKLNLKISKGFTLVELLVVIAIIGVLAAVVVLVINPLELTRRSRDTVRLTDLDNLRQAINISVQEPAPGATNVLCNGVAGACSENSVAGSRVTDGSGWVKVNVSTQKSVSMPVLPIDPVNTAGATGNHYVYCSDGNGWEIGTKLESAQMADKAGADGGNDPASYEVGSALTLLGAVGCTY